MISITEFRKSYFWSDISLTAHWLEALANLWGCWSSRVHLFDIFVTRTGAVCNRRFTARDAVECLGQVDIPTVNKVNVNVSNSLFFGTCVFVPVVDGTLITKWATELLRSQWNKYSQNPRPGSHLTWGTSCCNNQHWGNVSISEQCWVHYERMRVDFYSHLAQQCPCAVSILASHQSAIVDQTPCFNNSKFIENSSQSFLNLVITMDLRLRWEWHWLNVSMSVSGQG